MTCLKQDFFDVRYVQKTNLHRLLNQDDQKHIRNPGSYIPKSGSILVSFFVITPDIKRNGNGK